MKEMNGTHKTKNARPGATALVPGDGDEAAARSFGASEIIRHSFAELHDEYIPHR